MSLFLKFVALWNNNFPLKSDNKSLSIWYELYKHVQAFSLIGHDIHAFTLE